MVMAEIKNNPVGEEDREMEEWMAMAAERIGEDFGGYVFIVDDHHFSMQASSSRWMFGMTHDFQEQILHITPGTLLFVYDCKANLGTGVYEAVSHGGMNLDIAAWHDHIFTHESRYPAQVYVSWVERYPPMPGNIFWSVIGEHQHPPDTHLIRLTVLQAYNMWEVFAVNRRICDVISAWGAG